MFLQGTGAFYNTKMRSRSIAKQLINGILEQSLFQTGAVITKWSKFVAKWEGITSWCSCYKLRRNTSHPLFGIGDFVPFFAITSLICNIRKAVYTESYF